MYNGIINVYKEKGFTSHDVVAKLRGITKQKKIGHTGTLDPDAEGVLPVCFGNATKLCDLITDKSKEYRAVMLLGQATDTQDTTGKITESSDLWKELTIEEVSSAVLSFIGEYDQIPPMYSAIKINGQKMYELARKGETVERKPRRVTIENIEIVDISLPYVTMTVSCSKGTYIRTLCNDIGEKLGCFGTMDKLLRTRVGKFYVNESVTLSDIQTIVQNNEFDKKLIPAEEMFDYEKIFVKEEFSKLIYNGNKFHVSNIDKRLFDEKSKSTDKDTQDKTEKQDRSLMVRVYDYKELFIGIYERKGNVFSPVKMFL